MSILRLCVGGPEVKSDGERISRRFALKGACSKLSGIMPEIFSVNVQPIGQGTISTNSRSTAIGRPASSFFGIWAGCPKSPILCAFPHLGPRSVIPRSWAKCKRCRWLHWRALPARKRKVTKSYQNYPNIFKTKTTLLLSQNLVQLKDLQRSENNTDVKKHCKKI